MIANVSSQSKGLAIISVGQLFGGVERHILGLLDGLQASGIHAPLYVFHDGELADQARYRGFEVNVLPRDHGSLFPTARALAHNLARRKVRVVHVHGYKAAVYCAVARHWYRFAVVKTEHGLPESTEGRPLRNLRGRLYHLLDDVATRSSASTVCYVTDALQAHFQRAHSTLRKRVISNGIAAIDERRLPRPAEYDSAAFNVAVVGRLASVKGHHFAIEAVGDERTPSNVHLHIIGTGPCEAELRESTAILGVTARVHFLGFRRNIYDFLTHCDALLMPSLHEGLPYTLLEAMALATPIIASRVGGLAETMTNDINALLVPPSDTGAIADALKRLHADDALRNRLGKNAAQLQRERYSLESMVAKYVEVYQSVTPDVTYP